MRKLLFVLLFAIAGLALHAQWVPQSTGFPQASVGVNYISAVDANVLWAKGYDGSSSTAPEIQVFTRTNNGGTNWNAGTIPGYSTYGVSMILGIDYNTAWVPIWAPNGGGKLLKTSDGGSTWVVKNSSAFTAPAGFPNWVHFFNANDGIVMGDPNGGYFEIYTTTDGGDTWVRVPTANIPAPSSTTEYGTVGYFSAYGDNIWFGTTKGRVLTSHDKGNTWTVSVISASWTYTDVNFLNATHGMAIDRSATGTGIYETLDGGATWASVPYTGTYYTNSFDWVPGTANTCVCTGSASTNSGCGYSFDGGHTWTDFNGTSGVQFLYTTWVDTQNGWAGQFTDVNTPATLGGMFKYNDNLVGIVSIDPKEGGVQIYPNPGNGEFTVAIVGFEHKDVNINIFNIMGQKVYSNQVNQNLISYNQSLDLTNLAKGTYIAEVQCGTKVVKEKLVIR